MIKKVILDMDGVLTNFHKGVCDAFNESYVLEELIQYDFWEDWSGPPITRSGVNSICNQDFWKALEWMPEGREIVRIVEEAYRKENIFLFTMPMPNPGSWTGKRVWVELVAPDYINRLIVTAAPRSLLANAETLLIDDKNENVDGFIKAGGNAILIPRPWNRLRGHKVTAHLKDEIEGYTNRSFSDAEISREVKPEAKRQFPVSHKDYMSLSDAYDKHSRTLVTEKGEEYSIGNDFLCMENRLAGMTGDEPEKVSLIMAGKHITSLGIILEKQAPEEINLAKLDERIRDGMNLLKITAAFIHAKQNDFSLHLGKNKNEK